MIREVCVSIVLFQQVPRHALGFVLYMDGEFVMHMTGCNLMHFIVPYM